MVKWALFSFFAVFIVIIVVSLAVRLSWHQHSELGALMHFQAGTRRLPVISQHLILALPFAHRKPWNPARLVFLSWSSTSRSSRLSRQTQRTPGFSWGSASMWCWPSWLSSWCVYPPSPSSSHPWWRAASTSLAPSLLWLFLQYFVKTGTIFCVP